MKVEKTWIQLMKKADFKANGEKYGIDQVTARIIRNKDIVEDKDIRMYLYGSKQDLYNPSSMKDIDLAAGILKQKIEQQKKIRIIGDYDSDGINATYILLKALQMLGGDVSWDIPHRIKDGYGVNVRMVEAAASDGADTLITCDNGIAAKDAIDKAKELGMTVVITDHHEPPVDDQGNQMIYEADAVVDPKQRACEYPYKELCGAAVAFKLMCRLYELCGKSAEKLDFLLEHVAIATITDVVPLTGENRILVKEGLKRLSHTTNLGLQALMEELKINPAQLRSDYIGFQIGPCLNATGRLEDAARAVELLLADNALQAEKIAKEIVELNAKRKSMSREGEADAKVYVETHYDDSAKVLVIYLPQCHESIAGIIAGHIKEAYNRPTFVLTKGKDCIKGSGRSIEEYNMFDGINGCKDLLLKFGGHHLAAGISLEEKNIELFARTINDKAALTQQDLLKKYYIDVPMPFPYVTTQLIREMSVLEPYGKDNEKPLFAQKDAQIIRAQLLGENQNFLKLQVQVPGGSGQYEMIAFGYMAEQFAEGVDLKYGAGTYENMLEGKTKPVMTFAYQPTINTFRDMEHIQFEIVDFM
ncbi:MAG: single-stranded-DNA-specific exonuclease RecJ [Eubacterium sp.]|nr:single-stranded-DNA-specific exonuclease RecJ [Eubacterium sp.]